MVIGFFGVFLLWFIEFMVKNCNENNVKKSMFCFIMKKFLSLVMILKKAHYPKKHF